MAEIKITFNDADNYDRYMGRWSRTIGERFLAWLDPPQQARWLDVGCGTGAFSELILKSCAPASLTGVDPSPQQIEYVRKLLPPGTFQTAEAMELPFGDGAFDVVASALVIHFIPDRHKAFAEMNRVLQPGGVVGGYTWKRTPERDFAPYTPVLRAAVSLGGEALHSPIVPEGSVDGMRATLSTAGFVDIAATEIEVSRRFADFDEYWEIQTAPFSPSGRTVAKLTEAQRASVRDLLRETMPGPDGSVTYSSCAIAGKARKP